MFYFVFVFSLRREGRERGERRGRRREKGLVRGEGRGGNKGKEEKGEITELMTVLSKSEVKRGESMCLKK